MKSKADSSSRSNSAASEQDDLARRHSLARVAEEECPSDEEGSDGRGTGADGGRDDEGGFDDGPPPDFPVVTEEGEEPQLV
jgi:hypothetical protein